jgi:polyhydroxyalkanoate synthesis regulator phasin
MKYYDAVCYNIYSALCYRSIEEGSFSMIENEDLKTDSESTADTKKVSMAFYQIVRRIMLAGIGAIALKHDEMEEFIDKLVERGEIARKDGESLMNEMKEKHNKYLHNESSYGHRRIAEILDSFSVPTKTDLHNLNEKISSLEKKIDKLSKSK